jgi:hypothetical protein
VRGIAYSTAGTGVLGGASALSGATTGVLGSVASPAGRGVCGVNSGTNGGTGVLGVAAGGGTARGVYGRTSIGVGVFGQATGSGGTGVSGHGYTGIEASGTYGVTAHGGTWGVYGSGTSGVYGNGRNAVFGDSLDPIGNGVFGRAGANSSGACGVRGVASFPAAYAAHFTGKTHVQGTFTASNKQFLIDHPQDPANKTLAHSCVEAPEMLNVYSGSATLDAQGTATVRMPRYFRFLNRDHRYQLTAIGTAAPNLHIARKITASSFRIAGGTPGQEVCWIVTGVRADAWADQHPLRVERFKKPRDRGRYFNPEVFGKPKKAGINYAALPKARPTRRPRKAA